MKARIHLGALNFCLAAVFFGGLFSSAPFACAENLPGGIGVQLDKTNGVLQVKSVLATGPAENAGITAGLKIISIDGAPTADMTLTNAVNVLRGAVGATVKLEVMLPDGARREASLARVDVNALIQGGPVVQHRPLTDETALLIVRGFGTNTADGVIHALAEFEKQGVKHVALDLRNNDGGYLAAATAVASLLIGRDTRLWKYQQTGSESVTDTLGEREKMWNGSLLVLVNTNTYSAAEMVASACQTSGRAKIWGQATRGSATTYWLATQPDGTKKRIARGVFLTATGEPLQDHGVKPDVSCNLPDEELFARVGEYFSHPGDGK